jgi:hypothetical protein
MMDSRRSLPPREQQHGAALVLAVAILGLGVLVWQQRGSLSQLLLAQQSLDQATRASALAASQLHARLLNAHAFLNRTAMAHQVAMAHLLTIASAEKMRLEMSQRFLRRNPPVHLIAMMFGPHHAAAYAASRLGSAGHTHQGIRALEKAFRAHDRSMGEELEQARIGIGRGVSERTRALVQQVLNRNLTGTLGESTQLKIHVANPAGLVTSVRANQEPMIRQAWFDSVMQQHEYLQSRRHTATNFWVVNPKCPHLRHQLRRRGKTELQVDGNWQATDTLSFHAMRGNHWLICYWREYPMGWSKVDHYAKLTDRQAGDLYRAVTPEGLVGGSFIRYILAQHALGNLLLGLNNTLGEDLAEKTRIIWQRRSTFKTYTLEHKPVKVVVRVEQPLKSLSSPVLVAGLRLVGLLEARSEWGNSLHAQAAAEAYFDRYEPRPDSKFEAPSLFQPFWLARNVPVNP